MYIDSPNISGSLTITGSLILNGTAVTASGGGGGSGAGFPFSGSAVITGSLYVSGGNISGSFVGDGAGITGVTIDQFATFEDTFTNAPSHSAVHNFGTKNVFVQVFESDDTLLIPYSVTTTTANQVDIVFGDTLSGRVVIGKAGHILQDTGNFVSSSTAVQTFTNAVTASINHYLDSFNVITQVFDSNNNVIVPSNIKVATKDRVDLTFASSRSGKVVIAKAGHIVSGTAAVSASLATTAERVRAGSSGSRPTDYANIETGSLWYNTDSGDLEVFTGVSASWWQSTGTVSTLIPPVPYNVDFLVVAGGGGGGGSAADSWIAGGGGAGGLRTSYGSTSGGGVSSEASMSFDPNTVYTIIIGGGGARGTQDSASSGTLTTVGTNGDDSSISGNGLTTLTSSGGGGGGASSGNASAGTKAEGLDGGSGGGSASNYLSTAYSGGSGTAGQGYDGGAGSNGGSGGASGGGGAGGAGSGPRTTLGGGGNALEVNIVGGSGNNYAAGGAVAQASSQTDATVNSGNGGDSTKIPSGQSYTSANGGSGVVILRIPTTNYTGTTTGSPTVTTDGSYTILKYTQSGTYTA